jgi:hypothetical protein
VVAGVVGRSAAPGALCAPAAARQPKSCKEIVEAVDDVLANCDPHNLMTGELSPYGGLARWRRAQ